MHTTSASLLQRLRQPQDQAAWTRFVGLYTPLLYHWAKRAGLQEQDAADLVQDVLTLLLQKLPQFTYRQAKGFRAWLRTVTLNQWRDRLKRRATMPLEGNSGLDEAALPDNVSEFEEDEYRRRLVSQALQLMQADFQPATWKACWEVVVQGRDAADVAAELGMSVGAVYVAKFRVLNRLRQELDGLRPWHLRTYGPSLISCKNSHPHVVTSLRKRQHLPRTGASHEPVQTFRQSHRPTR